MDIKPRVLDLSHRILVLDKISQTQWSLTSMNEPNNPSVDMNDFNNPPVAIGHVADAGEASLENHHPRSPMSGSTRNPTGLLDLPVELRLDIFRYLLVSPHLVDIAGWQQDPSSVAILRTNRLIHREAADVYYRENRFTDIWKYSGGAIMEFPRILDPLWNFDYKVDLPHEFSGSLYFLKIMRSLGTPSNTTRGTLTLTFCPDSFFPDGARSCRPLNWFIRALGRCTNFQTIELHVYQWGIRNRFLTKLEYLEARLKPVLGDAEDVSREENGLRFHPIDHRIRCREMDDGHADWADSLDGIRLGWNDDVTEDS